MARNVTEVDFISDKIYDRVHDKDAFMSTQSIDTKQVQKSGKITSKNTMCRLERHHGF